MIDLFGADAAFGRLYDARQRLSTHLAERDAVALRLRGAEAEMVALDAVIVSLTEQVAGPYADVIAAMDALGVPRPAALTPPAAVDGAPAVAAA